MSVIFGRMEEERTVPNTRFFGLRLNFRPIPSLEIGLSRTAQWCGDGRPCDFDTFIDLLLGKDNRGDPGVTPENEPGNQLAGVDFRWAVTPLDVPIALYGQLIGEDEASGFPSRFIGQFGIEGTGVFRDRWSYRWFGEAAATTAAFYQSEKFFNFAYNHAIYWTGYRYRGRAVGHGTDNDSQVISFGLTVVDEREHRWNGVARFGDLNRYGIPDNRNSLTPTKQEIVSLDLTHSREFRYGVIEVGLGYVNLDDIASAQSDGDTRAFIQWRSEY
jgi:hypothetical protein